MTLLTLSVKNLKHKMTSYTAFVLSSSFSVWLFYSFTLVLLHPAFANIWEIAMPVKLLQWIVAGFSVLFILYSHSAFMKTRKKEFGVFTQVGMLPGQIARLVHYENGIIGVAALTVGITIGAVYSKLFFLVLGRALGLETPVTAYLPLSAALQTVLVFAGVFGVISIYDQFVLWRMPISLMFREAVKPKVPPRVSKILVSVCVVGIGIAYALLLTANSSNIEVRLVPIMLLLLLGTYLIFAQGSTALVQMFQRNRMLYYNHTNLLTISQLVFKLRDNARILFMVSILTTLVLTGLGLYYGAFQVVEQSALRWAPIGLMVVGAESETLDAIDRVLREYDVDVDGRAAFAGLRAYSLEPVDREGRKFGLTYVHSSVFVVSVSQVNMWMTRLMVWMGMPIELEQGHAAIILPENMRIPDEVMQTASIEFGEMRGEKKKVAELIFDYYVSIRILNEQNTVRQLMVVDDETFHQLFTDYADTYGQNVLGYAFSDWKESNAALEHLKSEMSLHSATTTSVTGTVEWFKNMKQDTSVMLLLVGLLSLLFFLAAGNMIYFKLFTDLFEDRKQFQVLHKVGVCIDEVRKVISIQTLILFFAPLIVAVIHAGVAISVIGRMLAGESLFVSMGHVVIAYVLIYGIYYILTRRTYVRVLMRGL
jgi:putative ABC transport system permease protein